MPFLVTSCIVLACIGFISALLAYRFRYIQNAALYLPQMPPDSRTNCPNPSAAQGFNHFEILSIPTRDGIMLRGYVIRPAAISEVSQRQRRGGGSGACGGRVLGGSNNSGLLGVTAAAPTPIYTNNTIHNNSISNTNGNVCNTCSTAVVVNAAPVANGVTSLRSLSASNVAGGVSTPTTTTTLVGDGVSMLSSTAEAALASRTAIETPPAAAASSAHHSLLAPAVGDGNNNNNPQGVSHHQIRSSSSSSPSPLSTTVMSASTVMASASPLLPTAFSPDTSDTEKGVIIYFHGNAGNVSHRLPIAYYLAKVTQCSVVMVDYRGYGRSDDPPYGFTPLGGQFSRYSRINNNNNNNRGGDSVASNPNSAYNTSSSSSSPRGAATASVNIPPQPAGANNGGDMMMDLTMIKKILAESAERGVTEEGLQTDTEAILDYVLNRNVSGTYPHYQRGCGGEAMGGININNSNCSAATTLSSSRQNSFGSSGFAHPHGKVFVMGTSLGGAAATYVTSHADYKDSICGLILENTFMSVSEMVDDIAQKILCRYSSSSSSRAAASQDQRRGNVLGGNNNTNNTNNSNSNNNINNNNGAAAAAAARSVLLGATGANTAPVGGIVGGGGNRSSSSSNDNTSSSPTQRGGGAAARPLPPPPSSEPSAIRSVATALLTRGSCLNSAVLFLILRILKPIFLFIGWNSGERIATIAAPILFLSGRKDEIVPAEQMDRLYLSANKTQWKKFASFPEGMHNDLPAKVGYFNVVAEFVDNVLRPQRQQMDAVLQEEAS